jgi:hypothetical protein
MLYKAEVAVCSEVNTKHINTVWVECQFLSFKPVGATQPVGLKRLNWWNDYCHSVWHLFFTSTI